jgi:hypothetical protein
VGTTTTVPSTTTAVPGTTTTSVPIGTSTTMPGSESLPGSDLPWELESVPATSLDTATSLPPTGAGDSAPIALAGVILVIGTSLQLAARRRRR